jgi:metal-dependent amidase/aminoacylase/carboxypeptidase family protein
MMVHPGVRNIAITEALACATLEVEFFGKAAHAAAHPDQGINALEAIVLAFNALNSLRQHTKDRARIHGIITHGGESANVVPAYSAATFLVRAPDRSYLDELRQKVLDCFSGASMATGARLEYKWSDIVYETMNNNLLLAQLFAKNLESLGRSVEPFEISFGFGSTDMGNVSQVAPAIHPMVAVATPDISLHSSEFATAAASEEGHSGLIDAAKALAMTVVDLLSDNETLASVKSEFFNQP